MSAEPITENPGQSSLGARAVESGGAAASLMAVGLGLVGVVFLAFFVYWFEVFVHRGMPQLTYFSLTPLVLFMMFIMVGAVNPLLRRFAGGVALGRRNLLVILALWLLAGAVSFRNLAVPPMFMIGNALNPIIETPEIKRAGVAAYLRSDLFLAASESQAYYHGLADGVTRVPLFGAAIPWRLWLGPLSYWLPLMVVVVIVSTSLVRILHHQWSENELLTFPLADVADQLLGVTPGRYFPDIFHSGVFWLGFACTAFIYVINGLHNWFPLMIEVPLEFEHRHLLQQFPFLSRYCGTEAYALLRGWAWPFMIAIAVLLPTDVSLTCWLGYVLMILGCGVYFFVTGDVVMPTDQRSIHVGMYLSMGAMILYLGRHEYASILRLALSPWRPAEAPLRGAVRACRVYLLASCLLVVCFSHAGMAWPVALFLVLCFSLVVILIARITAEVGIPWLSNFSGASSLLTLRFLGGAALGPHALAVLATVGSILHFDASNTVAAQTTTVCKLSEGEGDARWSRRFHLVLLAGLALALGSTAVFTIWSHYSFGASADGASRGALLRNLGNAATEINRQRLEQRAAAIEAAGPLARLANVQADPRFWRFLAAGAAIIVTCQFMRLRFWWWPLHPLPLLLVNTWALSRLYHSCLIGWLIKLALIRIGGGMFYRRTRPFFFGVIYGHIVVCCIWMVIGAVYYARTGVVPPRYRYFS